jgi:transglutaminase-like putative cysteine protease
MSTANDLEIYLQPGACINSDALSIQALARFLADPGKTDRENAVALYYWVRDTIRYNPYTVARDIESLKATTTVEAGEAWCVPKAVLLAALCRAAGIPAQVGFADVRNHLSTQRLRESMGTDVFYFHGYSSIYLDGQWVKATPAFNLSLCEKFGLKPLEFDGLKDSLYHEFDTAGNRHMEYIRDRGEYLDVPFAQMIAMFTEHYPKMMEQAAAAPERELWHDDVARETGTD